MADNFDAKNAAGTDVTFKSKDIGGVQHPGKVLYDEAGAEVLGLVDANPAANTVLGRLKALLTGIVLAAGTAVIGRLVPVGHTASASITRTNDTNAYNAGDIIGAATGSTAAIEFTSVGQSGGEVMITGAELEIDASAVISGESTYELHLYNVTPPSASGDNAAWDLPSGDRASFLGTIPLGAPVDLGSTLYVQSDGLNMHRKLSGTSIFAYLKTVGAYTPTASRVYKVTLHTVEL